MCHVLRYSCNVNAAVADSLRCHMICGTVPRKRCHNHKKRHIGVGRCSSLSKKYAFSHRLNTFSERQLSHTARWLTVTHCGTIESKTSLSNWRLYSWQVDTTRWWRLQLRTTSDIFQQYMEFPCVYSTQCILT